MADSLPVTSPGLIDVIAGVLAEDGPMTEDQLVAAVAGRRVDLGDTPGEALDEALDDGDGLVTVLADERWASFADPTRRDDLIRLLDSFPTHHDNPGTMDPDRLRTALDLR